MSDTPDKTNTSKEGDNSLTEKIGRNPRIITAPLSLAFLYAAGAGGYFWWLAVNNKNIQSIPDALVAISGGLIVIFLFYASFKLAIISFSENKEVIPERDRKLLEPLITSSNDKAIEQYIRISSLAGATGTATRLGLTGLPLLTVALTLIFSGIAIFDKDNGFMDLAKLTLGAFIGSFVQRTATEQSISVGKKEE